MTPRDPGAASPDDLFVPGDTTVLVPSPGRRRDSADETRFLTPGVPHPRAPSPGPADLALNGSNTGANALITAAAPALALVVQLRSSLSHTDPASLREEAAEQIRSFERAARSAGAEHDAVHHARYVLCTVVDETVLNHPWGAQSEWATRNLLTTFHQEVTGGEKFFQILNERLHYPAGNLELLEFMYVCLGLGFQGKYRLQPHGARTLDDIRDELFRSIRNQRGDIERSLASRWKPVANIRNPLARYIPLWVVAASGALMLFTCYTFFLYSLYDRSEPVEQRLAQVGSVTMEVNRESLQPEQSRTVLQTLRELLHAEIAAGQLEVEARGQYAAVVLRGDGLFKSGSASVRNAYLPLLERVAEALNGVTGKTIVTGHTDSIPIRTRRFPNNMALSRARAEDVRSRLGGWLDDPDRLRSDGRADREPLAGNDTPAQRARNRRVEILVAERAPAL